MEPFRTYRYRRPRATALAGLVSSLEFVRNPPPHPWERIVPSGGVMLMIMLDADGFGYRNGSSPDAPEHEADGACLVGPTGTAQVVSTTPQRGMVAVNFAPGGAAAFLPCPVSAAADGYLPLTWLWGASGAALRDRVRAARSPEEMWELLEQHLLQHLQPAVGAPAVIRAAAALDRGARVADVVAEFGTTAKPFVRRFRATMGLNPKRYARVRRLQRVLRNLPTDARLDWAETAHLHGFADQSHLIHDFGAITGVRPSDYSPRAPGEFNHLAC